MWTYHSHAALVRKMAPVVPPRLPPEREYQAPGTETISSAGLPLRVTPADSRRPMEQLNIRG